ncbi:hypothetical protein PCANC_23635 [Puccinia coronata f. sp. avenae]|uniref:Uncharacterized protein n=1 Tax=Puccinia coronata f. sp. avenae TaxID=200324 RepID=A0A2N5U762_9BASI|nr:hypothetical protein PCANC_23635 [Puccinia coronata f. sp. avenae]
MQPELAEVFLHEKPKKIHIDLNLPPEAQQPLLESLNSPHRQATSSSDGAIFGDPPRRTPDTLGCDAHCLMQPASFPLDWSFYNHHGEEEPLPQQIAPRISSSSTDPLIQNVTEDIQS